MTEPKQRSLLTLGQSIADAALPALREAVAGPVSVVEVTTLVESGSVEEHIVPGIVVADAGSTDGAAGRSLLIISREHARLVAGGETAAAEPVAHAEPEAASAAEPETEPADDVEPPAADAEAQPEPADDPDGSAESPAARAPAQDPPPAAGEAGLSTATLNAIAAIADAVNAAAANALTILLGAPVRYVAAEASIVEDPRFVVRPGPVQALCVTFEAADVTCRLIQFAPNALVMRAARAFEDLAQNAAHRVAGAATAGLSAQTLSGVKLRVWAELGRTELGLADALALPLGTVVELDREADAPVDLIVNGMRFGTGHLIVTDEGEWALALDEVGSAPALTA